jgi:hypothetical protein
MTFQNLPEDPVLVILEFLSTNKDMCSFRESCAYFKEICDTWGYLKHIKLGTHFDIKHFVTLYSKLFIKPLSLVVEKVNSPLAWIQEPLPRTVYFVSCYMGNDALDPPTSPTEELYIDDTSHYSECLKINWEKFPKLKNLSITASDVALNGLELCTNLEVVNINLTNTEKEISIKIMKLPKLKYIMINNQNFIKK